MKYAPHQNIQKGQILYPENRRNYYKKQNMQQIQEEYEERREINPHQNIPQQEENEDEIYEEEIRQYLPKKNLKKVKEIFQDMQKSKGYQGQRRDLVPQYNINKIREIYDDERREFYPQPNINRRDEEVYKVERRQYSQKINDNQNYRNFGPEFCPVHGIQGHKFLQSQGFDYQKHGFEAQREFRQEGNKNISFGQQNIFHTQDEIDDEILSEANNYKFFESKNVKNNDDNSITVHYTRGGDEKEGKSKGGSYYSKVYVATKTIPVETDSNIQKYQSFSQSNSSYNRNVGQSHIHSQSEFCPVHGRKIIQIQKRAGY